MKKVTDPSILAQLESTSIGKKVTDPALLDQLEGRTSIKSKLESAGRGALSGATLGFSDELEAALRGYLQQGKSYQDFYNEELPKIREKYKQSQLENPLTYGTADVAGSLIPYAASNVVAPGSSAALKLGALGATSAAGTSEAEQPLELAKDVAIGGGVGATLGKGSDLLGKAISKFSTKVRPSLGKIKSQSLSEALSTEIPPTIPSDKISQLVESGTQRLIGAGAGASLGSQIGSETGVPGAQATGIALGGATGAAMAPGIVKKVTPLITKSINSIMSNFPRYKTMLANAMQKGGNSLPAAVYALQQTDMAFRQEYQKVQDEARSEVK
jgi:hypothetical protein